MSPLHAVSIKKMADGVIRVRRPPVAKARQAGARSSLTLTAKSKTQFSGGWFGRKEEHRAKAGFGRLPTETRFGARGRDTLREFGAVVDELYGTNALFCTMTLPGTGDAQYRAIAEWSGYLVQRICQWFRDNLPGCEYGWVWEWQKRGALHFHCVVACNDRGRLDSVSLRWKEFCRGILQDTSARANINLFENTETGEDHSRRDCIQMDCQRMEKSALRYLSKYLGKRKEPGLGRAFYAPSRWWSVSNSALSKIKARRRSVRIEALSFEKISDVVNCAMQALLPQAVGIFHYRNKVFDWLDNYVVLTESAQAGQLAWNKLARALLKAGFASPAFCS